MGQAGAGDPGTGQKKGTPKSGQIRSESPGPPEPILAAVHPEPPKRHTHRFVAVGPTLLRQLLGLLLKSGPSMVEPAFCRALYVSSDRVKHNCGH